MPRTGEAETGGICRHVLSRGNGQLEVFHGDEDYAGFVELIGWACDRVEEKGTGYFLKKRGQATF